MAEQRDLHRVLIESEYRTWAQIVLDKHGQPWPIPDDQVPSASESDLITATKVLRSLGRTPHEG
jgi:hypothetical protein